MVVTMLVGLKAAPWLVHWLGKKQYGGFRVLNDAQGYLTLLELGLGGALGPLLARAAGTGDERGLRETLAAGLRAYARVVLITLGVGLALTPLVPWFASDLSAEEAADLRMGWLVGLAACPTVLLLPMRTVLEARQRGYVVNLLLTGQAVAITGMSLALAWAGWGITGQATAQVFGLWGFSLLLAYGVLRGEPGLLRAAITTPTSGETRAALSRLSWPTLLLNLSGRLGLLTDNLVVGGVRGTAAVTSLVNTSRLPMIGQGLLQGVGGASWAALAELDAQGDRETFNRRLIEMTRMVAVLGVTGLVPVVAFNRAFVSVWMGPEFPYGGDLVAILAAVNAVLLAEQSLWAWSFSATGKVREVIAPAVAAALVNVAASVALTYRIGLAGPLLGSTIGFAAVGLWALPWRLRVVFGTSIQGLARAMGVPCATGAIAGWGLYVLVRWYEPRGWVEVLAGMSLSGLAMLALSFLTLLTSEDRALWRGRIRGLMPGSGS